MKINLETITKKLLHIKNILMIFITTRLVLSAEQFINSSNLSGNLQQIIPLLNEGETLKSIDIVKMPFETYNSIDECFIAFEKGVQRIFKNHVNIAINEIKFFLVEKYSIIMAFSELESSDIETRLYYSFLSVAQSHVEYQTAINEYPLDLQKSLSSLFGEFRVVLYNVTTILYGDNPSQSHFVLINIMSKLVYYTFISQMNKLTSERLDLINSLKNIKFKIPRRRKGSSHIEHLREPIRTEFINCIGLYFPFQSLLLEYNNIEERPKYIEFLEKNNKLFREHLKQNRPYQISEEEFDTLLDHLDPLIMQTSKFIVVNYGSQGFSFIFSLKLQNMVLSIVENNFNILKKVNEGLQSGTKT